MVDWRATGKEKKGALLTLSLVPAGVIIAKARVFSSIYTAERKSGRVTSVAAFKESEVGVDVDVIVSRRPEKLMYKVRPWRRSIGIAIMTTNHHKMVACSWYLNNPFPSIC